MPTYVYGCDACGHQFEKFQKFSDEPVRECPNCGQPVRRILQPAGIVFKGSGWHITDYKRSSGNGAEASKDDAKAPKTSDDKAAAPTETSKSESKSSDTSSATPAKSA